MHKYRPQIIYALIILVITLIELPGILKFELMTPVYTVPYFSGAVNTNLFDREWKYNPQLADTLKQKNYFEQLDYKFRKDQNTNNLPDYSGYNNKGFLYIIKFSSFIFPFTGQMGSLVVFNLILHLFVSIYFIRSFKRRRFRILFLIFYCINPLILYVVITPYYYYLQIIPSFIFLYILQKDRISVAGKFLIYALSIAMFFIRPTTLLINAFNIFLLHKDLKLYIRAVASASYIILLFILSSFNRHLMLNQPWHTAVAGIGAYPSACIDAYPGDNFVFKTYAGISGDTVDGSFESKLYDPDYRRKYYNSLEIFYFDFIKDCPDTFAKNATLNVLQSYSAGYRVDNQILNYISALCGFIIIIILFVRKKFNAIIAIGLTSITFTPYHPPIVTYMFGAYLIIIYSLIRLLADNGKQKK